VQSKWFGETPKLVEAIFSLARKRSPCVVFVDEIDGVLSARNDNDMAHVNTMKTKFMECWDGLRTPTVSNGESKPINDDSQNKNWVLVIGATNKPWILDPAVLRRMPRQIFVGLPDAKAREAILRVILKNEKVEENIDLARIARAAENGYSGSDLKEVVRAAALIPIREAFAKEQALRKQNQSHVQVTPRNISTEDMLLAIQAIRPTGSVAREYKSFQAKNASTAFSMPVTNGLIERTDVNQIPTIQFGPSAEANSYKFTSSIESTAKAINKNKRDEATKKISASLDVC
jgi:SpoVK/Ycf46/Vps4 family AAA+-type ATPase